MDLFREARKIERALGVPVSIGVDPLYASVDDMAQSGLILTKLLGSASRHLANLKALHEQVYRARCLEKYRQQEGKCAQCGRKLRGQGEADHIKSRGAHGRDDSIDNLQVVCAAMAGGCDFHRSKHAGGKRKTA